MTYNDVRKNENKGFSLVELIVVIAIMAVLVAVLAPSLLQYVERSRAQKDDSAMGEVANAVMLALADQDVYDEVLCYTCKNNYSSYIDGVNAGNKVLTKNGTIKEFYFDDDARLADETAYKLDGNMRGMTITFFPDSDTNASVFTLEEAVINAGKNASNGSDYINGLPTTGTFTLGGMSSDGHHYLYNRVRATVGDKITLTSQTYRNSNYTVFVRMGSTGGNQADAQDAIQVYGQWSGTNLNLGDSVDANGVAKINVADNQSSYSN